VAIIIPYRKREQQLKIFLRHMHPMLKRQLLDYRIMVIEQAGETPFNRAMLFNIGYKEALAFHDFKCFVFHDVDLMPENDKNYYGCPTAPRHLSVAIDKFQYRLPYQAIFGGAGAFRKEDFEKINGFSNQFWGWGGEDDDLYRRITAKGFKLTRPGMAVGRYKMIRIFHQSAKADPLRFQKLKDSQQRMVTDGLNSLKYRVESVIERPLYTKVTVDINPLGL
ncbi:beta-1,4-N-acetylgalactosaminyltransferase bre-4-like, partial [Paramuricea clavata]